MSSIAISQETSARCETSAFGSNVSKAAGTSDVAHVLFRLANERHHHNVRIHIADFGLLELHFDQHCYRVDFPIANVQQALRARRYVVMATATHVECGAATYSQGPIAELIWSAAYQAPCGTIAVPENEPLRLASWPNFPRLPHRVEHIQLCALLAGHPMMLREIREHSGLPAAAVDTFLQTALLAGYVERCSADDLLFAPAAVPMARGGLLQRLLTTLGL